MVQWLLEWTELMSHHPPSQSMSQSLSTSSNRRRYNEFDDDVDDDGVDEDDGWGGGGGGVDDAPLLAPTVLDLLLAMDSRGNTPLHYACSNGRVDIVRALAKAVAIESSSGWKELMEARNENGRTPADWARAKRKAYAAREAESWLHRRPKTTMTPNAVAEQGTGVVPQAC